MADKPCFVYYAPGATHAPHHVRPEWSDRYLETPEFMASRIDKFGTPEVCNHFAVGWAHAMDTPYQWTKQVASHWVGPATARSSTSFDDDVWELYDTNTDWTPGS